MIRRHKLQFLAIFEPKVPLSRALAISRYLQMDYHEENLDEDSKIWILWNHPFSFQLVLKSSQHVTGVVLRGDMAICMVSTIYAACDATAQRNLFDELLSTAGSASLPWLVGDDFNCIAEPSEK